MSPLFAGPLPMTLAERSITAALGFGLVLLLSRLLRGVPSYGRCCFLATGVLLSLLGLDFLGVPDQLGVLAFVTGMFGAVLVGHKAGQEIQKQRRAIWLAASAVPIGLILALCLFGVWYWQTDPAGRIDDSGWYAVVFGGFGFSAGIVTTGALFLLDRRDRRAGPAATTSCLEKP